MTIGLTNNVSQEIGVRLGRAISLPVTRHFIGIRILWARCTIVAHFGAVTRTMETVNAPLGIEGIDANKFIFLLRSFGVFFE